jgi:hypothetical protein
MRWNSIIGLSLILAVASSSAFGFQEQGAETAAPAPEAAAAASPEAALAPGSAAKPASSGTEVSIPGLGKLGVLPKMDFGLELLYGANEPKQVEEEREVPTDNLTIRGSIKQPF